VAWVSSGVPDIAPKGPGGVPRGTSRGAGTDPQVGTQIARISVSQFAGAMTLAAFWDLESWQPKKLMRESQSGNQKSTL
jgi:hypothetical protein